MNADGKSPAKEWAFLRILLVYLSSSEFITGKIGVAVAKSSGSRRPAVFLDRDGTLMRDLGYLSDPTKVRLYPGTAKALRLLRQAGYRLIVLTNQSGVARGYFPLSAVGRVNASFRQRLRVQGVQLDAIFYCPHFPGGSVKSFSKRCGCRKPAPGMVRQACRKFPLDLGRSWMVGDKLDDLRLAGKARLAGAVLVRTGNGRKSASLLKGPLRRTQQAGDILVAARWILRRTGKKDT
jgi:D-glycero-D-manno-heptose 1,7-bisphosphate phosphatase